jgi:hypothetical protein
VGVFPRAALLERVSKSDCEARHRISSLALVPVVVWLSEGRCVMGRYRKKSCYDTKQLVPGSVQGTETGETARERESCCEVKRLLVMWGVPIG